MIKCPKCSAELTDTDVFCFTCGHKIEQTTLPDQSSEGSSVLMPCPKCQTIPASNEDIFCTECGTRLVQETVNIDPDMNNIHGNESIQIQTEPDEFPKIVEEPVIVKDDQPIQQTEIKTEPQKPAQQEVIKKPIVQQPVQPVVPVTTQSVAGKKEKSRKDYLCRIAGFISDSSHWGWSTRISDL